MSQNDDNSRSNSASLLSRNLTQTQALLAEAEAVLQRLARNRAAMTPRRGRARAPKKKVQPPEPATAPAEAQHFAPTKRYEFSDELRAAFTRLFATRGYVVNADVRAFLGMTMPQASTHLQALRDCGLLRNEGAGSLSRYYPGPAWVPSDLGPGMKSPPDPAHVTVWIAGPTEAAALADFSVHKTQSFARDTRLFPPFADPALRTQQFLGKLRSLNSVVLIARNDRDVMVGYAYCRCEHKSSPSVIGLISELVCGPEAHENVGLRLLESSITWLTKQGASVIRVHVPCDSEAARRLLGSHSFQTISYEMELRPSSASAASHNER